MADSIRLGKRVVPYENGISKNISFVVTQDCNLRCKYCYMTHKNTSGRMSLETAREAVDFFLAQDYPQSSVVWDFVGGEPLLEIDLIDRISDYIKIRTYETNHKWKDRYMFNMSSNGILYETPAVQQYLTKNAGKVHVGITIDGTKAKHDLNRVYRDGRGSYDDGGSTRRP